MSLSTPSKAEREWMDAVSRMPCIVCMTQGLGNTQAVVHHLLTPGGRRIGHLHTIPLCPSHHNSGVNTPMCVSRHPWRREFVRRYGTEEFLLNLTRKIINGAALAKNPDSVCASSL